MGLTQVLNLVSKTLHLLVLILELTIGTLKVVDGIVKASIDRVQSKLRNGQVVLQVGQVISKLQVGGGRVRVAILIAPPIEMEAHALKLSVVVADHTSNRLLHRSTLTLF